MDLALLEQQLIGGWVAQRVARFVERVTIDLAAASVQDVYVQPGNDEAAGRTGGAGVFVDLIDLWKAGYAVDAIQFALGLGAHLGDLGLVGLYGGGSLQAGEDFEPVVAGGGRAFGLAQGDLALATRLFEVRIVLVAGGPVPVEHIAADKEQGQDGNGQRCGQAPVGLLCLLSAPAGPRASAAAALCL